ncbi:hypothetical protein PybrP1_005643, partial [[Pythium] brassicae (nom. inval.)]
RYLGSFGLLVSALSLGNWMSPETTPEFEQAHTVVEPTHKLGINFFDDAEESDAGTTERRMEKIIQRGIDNGLSLTWIFANNNMSMVLLSATSTAKLDESAMALAFVGKITPEIRTKVDVIRLAALRRDQEIDGLRVYLIKFNLFPRNRDPHNSPIRVEELKELVKHWKLHRQRGFWRDHPDKDDLVRALLQHIRSEAASKKRRQEAQDKYRNKTLAGGDADPNAKLRNFTLLFGTNGVAGGGVGGPSRTQDDARDSDIGDDSDSPHLPRRRNRSCGGDLFYQRGDYDEGMIYLSRIDRNKFRTEDHNPRMELLTTSASASMPLDQLVRMGNASTAVSGSGHAGGGSDKDRPPVTFSHMLEPSTNHNSSVSAGLLSKEMKLKSVEGLYSISCHKGTELQLIKEGALATIVSVLKGDDVAIRLFSVATLLNLTAVPPPPRVASLSATSTLRTVGSTAALSLAGKEVYAKLIDEGVISALLELSHTSNATVKALCARALFRFTVDDAHHFRMVHEGSVVALTQLMATVPSDDVRHACMNGLVNLASVPRAVACDAILTTLVALAKAGKAELLAACGRALLNLSILPTTRSAVVEEGAVVALGVLAAHKRIPLYETISSVLCNLAAVKTNQDGLVKNGALAIVLELLDSVHKTFERVVEAGDESDEGEDLEPARGSVSDATAATSSSSSPVKRATADPDKDEAVAAVNSVLMRVQKNCANVLAHLCCNPKLQARVANAGFVPRLLRILHEYAACGRVDDDTEKFCVISLANLALDDRCRPTIVQDGGVPVLLRLLGDAARQDMSALLLKLDCVTALSNLMLHPKNFARMVEEGVVPAFLAAINDSASPEIQRACVFAMLNLARDSGMKTRLAAATADSDQGAIPTMLAFASKYVKDAELCGVCVSFLHHLSTRHENHDALYFEGAVGLLVRVLQRPSAAESPAVVYSLWLNSMATLANLASHPERRASLLDDGAVEAIQRFLSVSASDARRRDVRTDTKVVKTQFAAAQLLFRLHDLCCSTTAEVPAFVASLLLLATQLALKNSRLERRAVTLQQLAVTRCALTIAMVSLSQRGLRLLAAHVDIPPALNTVMRTGLHEAQVCAAIALCNLATERGQLPRRLWRDATTDDFIVITLLRVNSEQTKAICAKALFNLLAHDDTRDEMVREGVLYALIKLARLDSEDIRDLSLRSIYNISLAPAKALQLLEMEIVRVLAKMYQPEFSKELKRMLCGILSNLSSVPGGHERRLLLEGALGVLKSLAKVRDPETKVYVANILYNLSCRADVAEQLVRDEAGVLVILAAQLKSENHDVRRYGAATLANLSGCAVVVALMTEDALVIALNDAMKRTMAACVATTAACVFALRNLLSLAANQRKFVACNGVATLAAILACDEMASDKQTLRASTDMLCALANIGDRGSSEGEEPLEERLVRDGIVRALLAITKGAESGSCSSADEAAMSMNIATALSHLSTNVRCHDGMLRDGALDALTTLCRTNPGDARAPFKGLVGVRGEAICYHCATTLRNLSRLDTEGSAQHLPTLSVGAGAAVSANAADVRNQRIGSHAGLVQLVLALAQSNLPATREHVVVTLHSLALNKRCRSQLLKYDGVKTLLRLGTSASTAMKRHICSLALQALSKTDQADDPHVANIVQEGIVAAIAALADQHHHDVLVGAASFVSAVVAAESGADADTRSSSDIRALIQSNSQLVPQKGASPDWTKVHISSLSAWPEVEKLVESASRPHPHNHHHHQLQLSEPEQQLQSQLDRGSGDLDDDDDDDSYSDDSDSDGGGATSPSKRSLAVASPKIGVRVAVKNAAPSRRSTGTPRVCNADVTLGALEILADPAMDKVKINVDVELMQRRAAGGAGAAATDIELPKLRPASAPDDAVDSVSTLAALDGKPRKRSTLTQVRHEATAVSPSRASISGAAPASRSHRSPSTGPSAVSPAPSPLKSPATPSGTPKRKSRMLEPLAIPSPASDASLS